MENKSLNESIISIRVKLQNAKLKKSGKNTYAGFDYFELADFLPKLNELMLEERINDKFYIKDNLAILELQKNEEVNVYTMPFVLFETPLTYKKNKSGQFLIDKEGNYIQVPSMQDIQYLGALNTYYKRYLYLNAFGITDGEVIDSMNNNELSNKNEPDYRKELINYCKKNNIDMKKIAVDYQLVGRKLSNDDYYDVLCKVKTGLETEKK
nr:MAG TPA: ERF superfamily protein [Caudoviricetes sp.]